MTRPGSLQRLHGLGRNDLAFEKNFNRLIGLGDTQVEGHLEEMVESKEWKKLAEFLWSHNDTIEVSTALLEVLVEQRGPVEMLEEIFKPMKHDQGLRPLPLQSIALAQIGVTLVWSLNHEICQLTHFLVSFCLPHGRPRCTSFSSSSYLGTFYFWSW